VVGVQVGSRPIADEDGSLLGGAGGGDSDGSKISGRDRQFGARQRGPWRSSSSVFVFARLRSGGTREETRATDLTQRARR